jgi:hypothetical protein
VVCRFDSSVCRLYHLLRKREVFPHKNVNIRCLLVLRETHFFSPVFKGSY